jgi:HEPN domain-containing protein
MKANALEWIEKAEADFVSAGREYRARKRPNFDASCFFSQQCIEKYLKGRLVEAGIVFPKTHDLEALLDLILPAEPLWEGFRPVLGTLTSFAAAFRYPGESATREMARTALGDAKRIREQIRSRWDLAEHSQRVRKRQRPLL